MSTTTSATQSTNVKGIFNIITSNEIEDHTPLVKPTPTSNDPREYVTFQYKARSLKKKIEEHLKRLYDQLPSGLVDAFNRRCILSGSSISSMYHGEEPKDYDLWISGSGPFLHERSYLEALIKNSYDNYVAEYSQEYGGVMTGKVITENAITMKNKLQLITIENYRDARKNFDFIHCMPYYDLPQKTLFISEQQMDIIDKKKLVRNPGGRVPLEWRIEKFKNRGWTF
jgi:hypothetical protein